MRLLCLKPWFPLAGFLVLGAAAYVLVVTVGWRAVGSDGEEWSDQLEENRIEGDFTLLNLDPGLIDWWDDYTGIFPDDRGGQLLSELLPPSEKPPPAHDALSPRRSPPSHLDNPSLPLPPTQVDIPRLPIGKAESLRPRPLPEELPLLGHKADPPASQYLHTGDRVRLPSLDINQPIPLPVLAQPVTNRAPLDDATTDASLTAALAATAPTRTAPAPFLKLNLPDPFENRLKQPADLPEQVAPTHTGSRPSR